MADVITVSSSEDEENVALPPKKRIKPTPVLANLPNVTITKITKKKEKKQDVVVLCSDDDEDESGKQKEDESRKKKEAEEEVLCIEDKEATNKEKTPQSNGNHQESVIQICDELSPQKPNGGIDNESIEINDGDEDQKKVDEGPVKDLKDSCQIMNEDSEEESSGKENRLEESSISLDDVEPCSSKDTTIKLANTILLDKYLQIIDNQTQEEKYSIVKTKFPILLNYYSKCEQELGTSISFQNLMTTNIQRSEKSTTQAVISFNDIFQFLKDFANAESIEVDKEHLIKLKKLEKTIKKLTIMIKHLEEAEIDFDAEEDSSYLKLERYISRLDKVYKKYCQLLNKNPYAGRLTRSKLDFVDSEFNEINRGISKKYKTNKFPSYYEMEKFIKQIVEENKLKLDESKIKSESKHCFERLGELLQTRRRKELYDVHQMLIKDSEDPAKEDSKLSATLKNSYTEGQLKIEKLVAEFVSKEENKKDNDSEHEESEEESDKSNYIDSEGDEDDIENGKG